MPKPSHSEPQRVLPGLARWPVFDVAASRAIEAEALAAHPPYALMHAAGTAVARWRWPWHHTRGRCGWPAGQATTAATGWSRPPRCIALACRSRPRWSAMRRELPDDARRALADAQQAGLPISPHLPEAAPDLAIDALLGLGATRAPAGALVEAIERINQCRGPTLAVDLPTGLHSDTGQRLGDACVRATHTLALLTLKPGLFTADGRDQAGQIWIDRLGVTDPTLPPSAWLAGSDDLHRALPPRSHAGHKGRYGDVAVVGGAPGMTGAALLAARAALGAGAGRVLVNLLDAAGPGVDALFPEAMFRTAAWRADAAHLAASTIVCGCGGGMAVRDALPALLSRCPRLVLDADALNALAGDAALCRQLDARTTRGLHTVLTPHPLEAARLLGTDAASVQADRFAAAHTLAQRHGCVVLLKGSGSVIAAPGRVAVLNPTGNALLASGGTGDVLAGWLGGVWAQRPADVDGLAAAQQAAVATAWLHGHAADLAMKRAPGQRVLGASALIAAMREAAGSLGAG